MMVLVYNSIKEKREDMHNDFFLTNEMINYMYMIQEWEINERKRNRQHIT